MIIRPRINRLTCRHPPVVGMLTPLQFLATAANSLSLTIMLLWSGPQQWTVRATRNLFHHVSYSFVRPHAINTRSDSIHKPLHTYQASTTNSGLIKPSKIGLLVSFLVSLSWACVRRLCSHARRTCGTGREPPRLIRLSANSIRKCVALEFCGVLLSRPEHLPLLPS